MSIDRTRGNASLDDEAIIADLLSDEMTRAANKERGGDFGALLDLALRSVMGRRIIEHDDDAAHSNARRTTKH